jgi:hypothetical protein
MSPQPITVRLSPRRLEQLKSLGSALGLSIAETVAHLIREKIEGGVIPPDIPGISVSKVAEGVRIGIDGAEPVTYSREVAVKIADTMDSVASGGTGIVDMDRNFAVVRQGTGIKCKLPFSGPAAQPFQHAPSFPPDLVQDLANLIRQAAA